MTAGATRPNFHGPSGGIKGEGHSKNCIFFVNANKNVLPLTKVSASKVQDFHMKFISKETQNLNIVAAILSSAEQPGIFMMSFRLWDFVQKASKEPFNYRSGLWLLLSHNSEVDNRLEERDFAGLVKDAKSVVGFSPSCQFRVRQSDVT